MNLTSPSLKNETAVPDAPMVSMSSMHHQRPIKIFVVGLISLAVIVFTYLMYIHFYHRGIPSVPDYLTEQQKEVLTKQLNTYAEEHPLSDDDRYRMITGKAQVTVPVSVPAKTKK